MGSEYIITTSITFPMIFTIYEFIFIHFLFSHKHISYTSDEYFRNRVPMSDHLNLSVNPCWLNPHKITSKRNGKIRTKNLIKKGSQFGVGSMRHSRANTDLKNIGKSLTRSPNFSPRTNGPLVTAKRQQWCCWQRNCGDSLRCWCQIHYVGDFFTAKFR